MATQGVACTPRPSVAVTSTPNGDGRLRVTIAAGSNPGTPANLLQALQFTRLDNAVVQIGNQTGVSGNYSIAPPASSLTLYVARAAPGASTVEATVQDSCGPWPTLVGGGPSAF